ncbi:hypothetical protein [Desulfovibrio sp. JC010]|uniref:capsular polysaccharide export protein, LipB/KpsS family n=1 Tax=Desulfovibrio sp. JC010 TaxID=2593641 RepID=UPI0013D7BD38|nr:hypothetical protein [Desulfovibrio sp. JC010]NDV27181.1 hypothetical protein [Desulfovibrio sp. JC010]
MKKRPVLMFLSRPRLDSFYMRLAKLLRNEFSILVLLHEDSTSDFFKIDGIEVERMPTSSQLDDVISADSDEYIQQGALAEEFLNKNCYSLNINYILYEKYVLRYSRTSGHRSRNANIEKIFPFLTSFLKEVVEKYQVDYCFYEFIDTIESFILNAMIDTGMIKQAFCQILISVGGDLRVRLASGLTSKSPKFDYVHARGHLSSEAYAWSDKILANMSKEAKLSEYDKINRDKVSLFKKYSYSQIFKKMRDVLHGESLRPFMIRQINRFRARQYFSDSIEGDKNISFFLQLVPEAGLMAEQPEYANQEFVIELMALYGKCGYKILVKEHPACFGNHTKRFYKELSLLSNVVLLPPTYPTRDILLRSKAVVVATGTTVSLEAMALGIPIITYGDPYISCSKNVCKIERPQNVWDVLPDLEFNKEEQRHFFAALYDASYDYPSFLSDEEYEKGVEAAPVLVDALRKEIALYEDMVLPCSIDR